MKILAGAPAVGAPEAFARTLVILYVRRSVGVPGNVCGAGCESPATICVKTTSVAIITIRFISIYLPFKVLKLVLSETGTRLFASLVLLRPGSYRGFSLRAFDSENLSAC